MAAMAKMVDGALLVPVAYSDLFAVLGDAWNFSLVLAVEKDH